MQDFKRAKQVAAELISSIEATHPKVSELIDEHIEECFAHLWFPAAHQRRIRTTNGIERLNQEIKRRTRVIRIFPNREACLRVVTALCVEQSEEWVSGKCYLSMDELEGFEATATERGCELTAVN